MKIGDLVTYGKWFNGIQRVGIILETEKSDSPFWFVMWSGHEPEWECQDEIEVLNGA